MSSKPQTYNPMNHISPINDHVRNLFIHCDPSHRISLSYGALLPRLFVTAILLIICVNSLPVEAHAGFNVKRIEFRLLRAGHTHLKWVSLRYPYVVDACYGKIRSRMTFNKKRRLKARTKLGHCRHERLKRDSYRTTNRVQDPSRKGISNYPRAFDDNRLPPKKFSGELYQDRYSRYGPSSHYEYNSGPAEPGSYKPEDEVDEQTLYRRDRPVGPHSGQSSHHGTMPLPLILRTLRYQGYHNLQVKNSYLPVYAIRACQGGERYLLNVNGWGEIVSKKYKGGCRRLGRSTKSFQFLSSR